MEAIGRAIGQFLMQGIRLINDTFWAIVSFVYAQAGNALGPILEGRFSWLQVLIVLVASLIGLVKFGYPAIMSLLNAVKGVFTAIASVFVVVINSIIPLAQFGLVIMFGYFVALGVGYLPFQVPTLTQLTNTRHTDEGPQRPVPRQRVKPDPRDDPRYAPRRERRDTSERERPSENGGLPLWALIGAGLVIAGIVLVLGRAVWQRFGSGGGKRK